MNTGTLAEAPNTVTFPFAFPTAAYGLILCPSDGAAHVGGGQIQDNYNSLTQTDVVINNNLTAQPYFLIILGS